MVIFFRSCQNIIIGQTINIYYARKGSVYDPQNRIISVHKIYKRGTIGYKVRLLLLVYITFFYIGQ